jgi:hypothetical protein
VSPLSCGAASALEGAKVEVEKVIDAGVADRENREGVMNDEKDLGGHDAHGGRSDLEPAASPQLPHAAPMHTPGPWKWDGVDSFQSADALRSGDELVLSGIGYTDYTGGIVFYNDADAHLIAAAPDLLEALKQVVIAATMSIGAARTADAINAAYVAIAKAEGR